MSTLHVSSTPGISGVGGTHGDMGNGGTHGIWEGHMGIRGVGDTWDMGGTHWDTHEDIRRMTHIQDAPSMALWGYSA